MAERPAERPIVADRASFRHFDDDVLMAIEERVENFASALLQLLDEVGFQVEKQEAAGTDIAQPRSNVLDAEAFELPYEIEVARKLEDDFRLLDLRSFGSARESLVADDLVRSEIEY